MAEEGGEKKEVPREQLLLYIKKLKVKVKDLEGELDTVKSAHASLQSQHAALEDQMAEHLQTTAQKEEVFQLRLVKAAEEIHEVKQAGEARSKELAARLKEAEAALEEARRKQDGDIELAERCKRLETELGRAGEAEGRVREEMARLREESAARIQALEHSLQQQQGASPRASPTAVAGGDAAALAAQVEKLQQENADTVDKLAKVSEQAEEEEAPHTHRQPFSIKGPRR